MDEKRMLGLNELNLGAKLAAQVVKRKDAPPPTEEKKEEHLAAVKETPAVNVNTLATAPVHELDNNTFFDTWDKYYPKFVNLLGWVPAWVDRGGVVLMLKGLLAVVNNNVLPIMRLLLAYKDLLPILQAMIADKTLLAKVRELIEALQKQRA